MPKCGPIKLDGCNVCTYCKMAQVAARYNFIDFILQLIRFVRIPVPKTRLTKPLLSLNCTDAIFIRPHISRLHIPTGISDRKCHSCHLPPPPVPQTRVHLLSRWAASSQGRPPVEIKKGAAVQRQSRRCDQADSRVVGLIRLGCRRRCTPQPPAVRRQPLQPSAVAVSLFSP